MQSPIIGASLDASDSGVEIDVMESFRPGKIVPHNVFAGGYGQDMRNHRTGGGIELDPAVFHRFGLLFDETGYTFYIDGKEDGKITEDISGHDEFLLISTEVTGYRLSEHRPTREAFDAIGDTFLVDYVRVFDISGGTDTCID